MYMLQVLVDYISDLAEYFGVRGEEKIHVPTKNKKNIIMFCVEHLSFKSIS